MRAKAARAFAPLLVLLCTADPLPAAADRAAAPQPPSQREPAPPPAPAAVEAGIAVYFSPNGGALDAVADLINRTKRSIDVQAYLLTSRELVDALAEAHHRGVKVRVIVDSDHASTDQGLAPSLAQRGVSVYTDAQHKEAHDKVMILDGQAVVTGSFNFTKAAETENGENLLILTGKPKILAAYQRNFERHLGHAKALSSKK